MKSKRVVLFRAGTFALLIAVAALMMLIGRGHTVYLDNRTLEYGGQTYTAPYKVEAVVGGKRVAELYNMERGMAECIGQTFAMTLNIEEEEGADAQVIDVKLPLPYQVDGVIINLPAYLAGLPEEAYLTEFIPAPETNLDDTEIPSEEDILGDF
jgi:hypothetical protein